MAATEGTEVPALLSTDHLAVLRSLVAAMIENATFSKESIGLGNVDNTSDADKPVSSAMQTALAGKLDTSLKGANSGLAELDAGGKVPSSQLPSYVDDVLEYGSLSGFPETGETGKIYVDTSANRTYRWSGSDYVAIGSDLALGTTSSTAFRGDYGDAAYGHATDAARMTAEQASGLYKIAVTSEGHIASVAAVSKSDITALGIPGSDTTYSNASDDTAGLMSASDKSALDTLVSWKNALVDADSRSY